ncbi:bifunctional proline dehydrogenase/L-glutamate gamma-semialdehyde dehydrogenase PutA [Coralliovum pocilloporae]|uniref:bifunctional proline dehydrogenase/L-glutamate gamma-semialdehyde dehydrogenase PutA n=1 Tax=Coralliovum pocilloporae TaxID=3066369 RepID=UPI0033074967
MDHLTALRADIADRRFWSEQDATLDNLSNHRLSAEEREAGVTAAEKLIGSLRSLKTPGLMETFLAEYGLSTKEGVALMCLAEAYLRTPDARSLDALIRDKVGPGDWDSHRGRARSLLVNASTWALMLTGRLFRDKNTAAAELVDTMEGAVRRLGEPVARKAVEQAMKVLGRQFVLGRSIAEAVENGRGRTDEGYGYSFDMLGEAARTEEDARAYFLSYSKAIATLADHAKSSDFRDNPGISVKLSALHPRYEWVQRERVMAELVPRIGALAEHARAANIGLAIDAEEADRLELSLDVIEAVLRNPDLVGWDGFGVVVQAYNKQAPAVLDWLHALAKDLGRRITVRLVKGAYWDTEIKQAQVMGLETYPVYTRKVATDLSYLRCARLLLDKADHIYPQFATHNAHTAATILQMAGDFDGFEFQRLHGMGEALHELLRETAGRRCRIYAPVGVHKDLLAYLVRRLLENGANSSFVNQVLDEEVPVSVIAGDPITRVETLEIKANKNIPLPAGLYGEARRNAHGVNLNSPAEADALDQAMSRFRAVQWQARPTVDGAGSDETARPVISPSDPDDCVGQVIEAGSGHVETAIARAVNAASGWAATPVTERAAMLEQVADLYEANMPELIAIGCREAGKTRLDGILEVREAVDFCRYYAAEARGNQTGRQPLGPIACISPWNFPLAIFTGQIVAALVAGNPVLAKPAEQTPLMAARAIALMHQAGIPGDVLTLLPGDGATVGRALTSDPRIKGCCFTGSTETASLIDQAMAGEGDPEAMLIAETGGLNAMIVDSTALPEQAVRDIVQSAFQSAGQRCSALRVLFVQEDVADTILTMLEGAARELSIDDPWLASTDVGPVIDDDARQMIQVHCEALEDKGRLLFRVPVPASIARQGTFVAPAAFRLESFEEMKREIFGPVLHVLTYKADELDDVIDRINASGYGLTLGVHSRVDRRVDQVCARASVGNIYVNRNQIGAVVGVQPFGGEGLSGTGPKAGGPDYLMRFSRPMDSESIHRPVLSVERTLTGPTGESNTLRHEARGEVACLGDGPSPDVASLVRQLRLVSATGNTAILADTEASRAALANVKPNMKDQNKVIVTPDGHNSSLDQPGLRAVLFDGTGDALRELRQILAKRPGPRIPVIRSDADTARWLTVERVVSEDTTASGGNATLLADADVE